MYTTSGARKANHQWIPLVTSVGVPSYVNVMAYRPFAGNTLSSISCSSLGCNTFLQVPRTRLLFALAGPMVSRVEAQTPAGQAYTLATLSDFAADILGSLKDNSAEVFRCVTELGKLLRAGKIGEEGDLLDNSEGSEGEEE